MNHTKLSTNPLQMQNALRSLEDRCQKLQRKTDSLQSENERLLASRSELLSEVERLQEQQIRLRERNLRLTQEFHSKQQECSLLAEKLTMFARGRVGNAKIEDDSFKVDLSEVKEDPEGSADSLETVELQAGPVAKLKNLHAKRTLSEPNLSVIQRELDQVRKGLWPRATDNGKVVTVEELSSKIISNLKRGQNELEEQFSKMVEIQRNSLDAVQELSQYSDGMSFVSNIDGESDSVQCIERCTAGAVALYAKLQKQNELLRKLHQNLKSSQGMSDTAAMSVVTQTSFNMNDSINSSVWRNMQTDRVCPLCENVFPTLISQEEFEDHVMEHFSGEDTLLPEFEILP